MNILLDSCVSFRAAEALRALGHAVDWVGTWQSDPGDEAILRHAAGAGQVLVTLDADFGQLVVETGVRHCGIIRLVEIADHQHAEFLGRVLATHAEDLKAGALVTVEISRVRVRPAEGKT